MLLLYTNRKLYTGLPSVPKVVTLNDLERRNGRYFGSFGANYVKMVELKLNAYSLLNVGPSP